MDWVGTLRSGEPVYDRHSSHLHEEVVPILPEALNKISSGGRDFLKEVVEFGHPIGHSICVATGPGDQIVYAQRTKRFGLSRFVVNREPEECSSVVVILKKAEDLGGYILITAFVGNLSEPEPWDRNATPASSVFWANHALIWGCEPVVDGTVTDRCPW
ncbi:hypothetical protein GYA54_02070 [Candidatus Kuenenbacteria bacterium]|nr:hypothetical protein [Candidatus Kuenenbacteria bacterium]